MHGEGTKQCEATHAGLGWGLCRTPSFWKTVSFVSFPLSVAGGVPQVFLTAPSGTVQIPVSAVQLHQVGAEQCLGLRLGAMSSVPPWGSAAPDTGPLGTWVLG